MYTRETELYHYGVKGMHWGVRRYQNYDGSYTKAGLERYNKASSNYESASSNLKSTKESYKSGKASKSDVKSAKAETKSAKKEVKSSYKQLKNDYRADKGKELYSEGKTINSNNSKALAVSTAGFAGTLAGLEFTKKATTTGGKLAGLGVEAASLLGSTAVAQKWYNENKYLRAYYAHS